jgi:hypothetical protein
MMTVTGTVAALDGVEIFFVKSKGMVHRPMLRETHILWEFDRSYQCTEIIECHEVQDTDGAKNYDTGRCAPRLTGSSGSAHIRHA